MSKRNSITKAIAEKLKTIDGTGPYKSNFDVLRQSAHSSRLKWR
jgi:hypothetical protein